ncbi:MAG: DUF1027 domain-containing protein [Acholeplasmatales bacterium]|jgi:uncharacterized protein YutD|nr:DUF1027 domain-containing protein [Acholeplasmatales bacterium]
MVIDTKYGQFELVKNYKDAFNITAFETRYVDVAFDRYSYILGDIAIDSVNGNKLRLKGFSTNEKSVSSYKKIPDYLAEYCNVDAAYYILRRIK